MKTLGLASLLRGCRVGVKTAVKGLGLSPQVRGGIIALVPCPAVVGGTPRLAGTTFYCPAAVLN